MQTNDKQHYIYLRSTRERIPCTKEEFDNYYRDINAFRQKQQYHGRCVCPEKKRLDCDMDCATCPFSRAGDTRSLDYTMTDEDGNEKPWVDMLPDSAPLIEDLVADASEFSNVLERLLEIMPEAIEIGHLRMAGLSDVEIAKRLNVRNNTMFYRLKRAKELLSKEFPEIF